MSPVFFLNRWLELLREQARDEDERTNADAGDTLRDPDHDDVDIPKIGAWVGWQTMVKDSRIKQHVAFAKSIGLNRLDVIVNDHAADRKSRNFDTYPIGRIRAICREAERQDLEIHLMSWLMPHSRYIEQAASTLCMLSLETGASSIMFDAEEPWTRADKPLDYEQAATMLADAMGSVRWGVTGIGYAPTDRLGPLVRRCSYVTPQCYSTSNNTLDPSNVVDRLVGRWERVFGVHPLVVGLAAYRQSKIPGYTVGEAMHAAFAGARAAKAEAVVWWSLRHIRSNGAVSRAIRRIATSLAPVA